MTNNHDHSQNSVILPTGPGANPSSFPHLDIPVDPRVELPPEERRGGDYVDLPDGSRIAPNGAVIEEPMDSVTEIAPPNRYTPEKEDLDLLIM